MIRVGPMDAGVDSREKTLSMKVVKCWSTLCREVMGSLSLEVFRTCLDSALSNLTY